MILLTRAGYAKLLLAIGIMITVNIMPMSWGTASSSDVTVSIYPEEPYNKFYLGNEINVTIEISNIGEATERIKLHLSEYPENMLVIGRDGLALPFERDIAGGEDFYYGVVAIPHDNVDNDLIGFKATTPNDNLLDAKQISLEIIRPQLDNENLAVKASEYGLSEIVRVFSIPRYRRYWHPDRDEKSTNAQLGYVWLIIGTEGNILIDDNTGELIATNVRIPNQADAPEQGTARVWNGNRFENLQVPTVKTVGDLSFTLRRFELYYAEQNGKPVWVTRQILYWQIGEDPIIQAGGPLSETPDTERVELWVSAEDGTELSTISDYHFYSYKYDPTDSYTIAGDVHSPLPSEVGWQMWFSAIANYKNIYPASSIPHDRIGFTKYAHPLTRTFFEEYWLVVRRNLVGLTLVILVFITPIMWKFFKSRTLLS
ncbi:hypothetical protein AKJ35_00380 [candidate division MSBL1 archaeon SCGC-AAA833F18]|uniref:Uncharacterized protein n=3 Tax=candidate division MSBL1 TaxID=215777 RepID=A0A133VT29_9EURY|nr:hypothetical protein AKJ47_01690 [candidate division MSBL1 archaeon SCGC-AAA261G05]KXB04760.1 hypothetical protein AKJ48_01510 [candidate division MSBL1 archaeon SCGC-AAA261O19]KXB09602.1 hypothetical protein AKJ35_00380 [candidate division MSBL1 archaeon SCGC-AAA833F18]